MHNVIDVDWGPIAVWVGALASFLAVIVALLGGLGWFSRRHEPVLRLSFGPGQPCCRRVGDAFWVRVAVDNIGRNPAKGCVGRLIGLSTDGRVSLPSR